MTTDIKPEEIKAATKRALALQRLLEQELADRAIRRYSLSSTQSELIQARADGEQARDIEKLERTESRQQDRLDRTDENIDALRVVLNPMRFLIPEYGTDNPDVPLGD